MSLVHLKYFRCTIMREYNKATKLLPFTKERWRSVKRGCQIFSHLCYCFACRMWKKMETLFDRAMPLNSLGLKVKLKIEKLLCAINDGEFNKPQWQVPGFFKLINRHFLFVWAVVWSYNRKESRSFGFQSTDCKFESEWQIEIEKKAFAKMQHCFFV